MAYPVVYERAATPASGPQPGASALLAWALANTTATNLGIYNRRAVRGGKALSLHAEGRAVDLGFPAREGGTKEGWALAQLLRTHSADLGIQCLIYARRIWTNTKAAQGWRAYTGTASHNEHIHIELTRQAAARLTAGEISAALGGDIAVAEKEVREIQGAINAWLADGVPKIAVDGDAGPATVAALRYLLDEQLGPHARALEEDRERLKAELHRRQARVEELLTALDVARAATVTDPTAAQASLEAIARALLPTLRRLDLEGVGR